MMKKFLTVSTLLFALVAVPTMAQNPTVTMKTNKGDIVIELYADKAPATVANFLAYVDAGYYGGTIFHRVIDQFMIQGGGFDGSLNKKSTNDPIKNEADNGVANDRGTIAMARTGDPHSATAQFFINTVDNDGLNHTGKSVEGWGYCAFGKVTAGMDVVDVISKLPTTAGAGGHGNVPKDTVTIESVSRN